MSQQQRAEESGKTSPKKESGKKSPQKDDEEDDDFIIISPEKSYRATPTVGSPVIDVDRIESPKPFREVSSHAQAQKASLFKVGLSENYSAVDIEKGLSLFDMNDIVRPDEFLTMLKLVNEGTVHEDMNTDQVDSEYVMVSSDEETMVMGDTPEAKNSRSSGEWQHVRHSKHTGEWQHYDNNNFSACFY